MKFSDIKDESIRNLLRGAVSAKSEADAKKTLQHLRRDARPADALAAFRILRDSPLGQHLASGPTFPRSFDHVASIPVYEDTTLSIELMALKTKIENAEVELTTFVNKIGDLNRAVSTADPSKIASILTEIEQAYGASLFMMQKALSFKYSTISSPVLEAAIQATVKPFLKPKRQLLAVAFEDSIDRDKERLRSRRYFLGLATQGKIHGRNRPIICDMFSPLGSYEVTDSDLLQAYSRWSAIDAVFALWSTYSRARYEGANETSKLIQAAIPPEIFQALVALSHSLSVADLGSLLNDEAPCFSERSLFFHAAAWQEIDEVRHYRYDVENSIGSRLDGIFPVPFKAARRFSEPYQKIESLLPEGEFGLNVEAINPKTCGNFLRTIALIASVEESGELETQGTDLRILLDNTVDVAELLSSDEIQTFLPHRPDDRLYEYLRTVLLNEADPNTVTEHAFRRALQKIIIGDFDGNIVSFAMHLDSEVKHVANHFYYRCTDIFLTELYSLFTEADQIIDAHANLLDWFGTTRKDHEAVDRAKSHRLNLRLRRVRGAIDETRLYVDPLRFVQWMSDEVGSDLRGLVNVADDIVADQSKSFDLSDPLIAIQNPRLKLLSVLDQCYREFCTNKFNGIDSYIGRRIRHGSIHGQLFLEVREDFERASQEFAKIRPAFAADLRRWLSDFDVEVQSCATDLLHMQSDEKPDGWLRPTLLEKDKNDVALAMIKHTASALRDSATVNDVIGLIQEYCWLAVEVDLKRARDSLEKLRRKFLLGVNYCVSDGDATANQRLTECVRRLNAAVQHRFEVVHSWLTRPAAISPSASVTLLFEAVLDEISQRHPDYDPALDFENGNDLDLIGHRFHFFYDALSILVDNAAKHGRKDGLLGRKICVRENGDKRVLEVTVVSEVMEENAPCSITNIENAMHGEIGDAMTREGLSGLRKIRGLVTDVAEIESFRHAFEGTQVRFTITMVYPKS